MNDTIERACGAVAFTGPFRRRQTTASSSPVVYQNEASNQERTAWHQAIEQIQTFRRFKDDWDGDDAAAPGIAVVDTALKQAIRLRNAYHNPPDRVSASVNGSVVLEWWLTDRTFEVEVISPSEIEYRLGGLVLDHSPNGLPFE